MIIHVKQLSGEILDVECAENTTYSQLLDRVTHTINPKQPSVIRLLTPDGHTPSAPFQPNQEIWMYVDIIECDCNVYPQVPTVEQFVAWSIHSAYPQFTIQFSSNMRENFIICVDCIWVPNWNCLDVRKVSVTGTRRYVTETMIRERLKDKLKIGMLSVHVDRIVEDVMRQFQSS
jgi:hypothetical protein